MSKRLMFSAFVATILMASTTMYVDVQSDKTNMAIEARAS